MLKIKKQLNEIAQYPYDAYISTRRMARLMADVLEECSNRHQISLYANKDALFMRNNISLKENEYLYLMRQARRLHGYKDFVKDRVRRKRWTFCWQGSAIYFNQNIEGNTIGVTPTQEFVLPEVECRSTRGDEVLVATGGILDVIKQLSVIKRGDEIAINTGMRTKTLVYGKPIAAQFAIAVARAYGKHADKAAHPFYCRKCDREVMLMARFKVTFVLDGDNVQTIVRID